tara:strand:+ start:3000 stop:3338 length:339 start_codon:yes stop_codon:yes gene_type:complete
MTQSLNINNDFENKSNHKNNVELSAQEREAFKNEFKKNLNELDAINNLIEKHLDIEGVKAMDSKTVNEESDTLEMKQSYNDSAKIQRERMQRIGLLKSDPTGKNLKASGEDI